MTTGAPAGSAAGATPVAGAAAGAGAAGGAAVAAGGAAAGAAPAGGAAGAAVCATALLASASAKQVQIKKRAEVLIRLTLLQKGKSPRRLDLPGDTIHSHKKTPLTLPE